MQAWVHLKGCVAFEPLRDRAREWMRQEGPRCALAMRVCQAGPMRWPGRMIPEAQHGRFGTGPREVRVPDFVARGALACARGMPWHP